MLMTHNAAANGPTDLYMYFSSVVVLRLCTHGDLTQSSKIMCSHKTLRQVLAVDPLSSN